MSLTIIIILIISGILVGFINTLSAGGTTISIALYLALGIPAQITNAINRVGVLLQNGFASYLFYRKNLINYKHLILYSLPLLVGALFGSLIAINIDEKIFNICFAIVLLLMVVFLFIETKATSKQEKPLTLKNYLIVCPLFLITGFYGGFVQAGTGFLLIAVVGSVLGYDLIKTTAIKNTLMFAYTIVAMAVFLFRGGIETKYWIYALIHSFGNLVGSYIAAHYALKKGTQFIKIVIICVVVLIALNLLGVLDMQLFFKNFVN